MRRARILALGLALGLAVGWAGLTLAQSTVSTNPRTGGGATPAGFNSYTLRADAASFATVAASIAGASFQELDSSFRHRGFFDLTVPTEGRLVAQHTSGAGVTSRLALQYSVGACGTFTDSGIFTALTTINTMEVGAWTAIPVAMRATVCTRIGVTGGDGTELPQLANVYLQVR